jgi:hypothetical protein
LFERLRDLDVPPRIRMERKTDAAASIMDKMTGIRAAAPASPAAPSAALAALVPHHVNIISHPLHIRKRHPRSI